MDRDARFETSNSTNISHEGAVEAPAHGAGMPSNDVPEGLQMIVKKSGITTVIISGVALFSDGYTVQIVGYMEPVFSDLYMSAISENFTTRLSNSFLIGEIFGMLVFGFLIDRIGRRAGVVLTTIFLVLGTILSTAAYSTSLSGMLWMVVISRGIAGFGAGGEYPTCATGATEAADEAESVQNKRGILVALSTLFAIDLGNIVSGIVAIIVIRCYGGQASEGVWRICFGIGIVLPLAVFIYRFQIINSTQYRKHALKSNIPYVLALKLYWKPMLGTTMAWFCYDFIRYPFGLFSSSIVAQISPNKDLIETIGYGTLINLFYLPGTIAGGFLMDKIGRRQTMTLGFVCLSIMGFIIGGALEPLQTVFPLFVILYGIFQATGEMGPGVATFLCASESFPTPVRGHFLGLAAAMGKVGAAIGTQVFKPIEDSFSTIEEGQRAAFLIGSGFALLGAIVAWTLIPDKSRQLDDEDKRFCRHLAAAGYNLDSCGETMVSNLKFSVYELEHDPAEIEEWDAQRKQR